MLSIRDENLIPATSLPRIIPGRNGKKLNYSTIWRWILDGVKTPRGVVRLEAVKCGGQWLTSMPAIERFVAAQTPSHDEAPAVTLPRTASKIARAAEAAQRELAEIGI